MGHWCAKYQAGAPETGRRSQCGCRVSQVALSLTTRFGCGSTMKCHNYAIVCGNTGRSNDHAIRHAAAPLNVMLLNAMVRAHECGSSGTVMDTRGAASAPQCQAGGRQFLGVLLISPARF